MLFTVVQGYLENLLKADCDIHTLQTREGAVPAETVTEGIYDYAENVESGSTLSTPTSSHTGEAPFASEGLGDTVIHLDKVSNISNTRDSVSTRYPSTEKRVGNTTHSGVFLHEIRGVRIADETLSRVFDISSQSEQKLRSKRRSKIIKIYAN